MQEAQHGGRQRDTGADVLYADLFDLTRCMRKCDLRHSPISFTLKRQSLHFLFAFTCSLKSPAQLTRGAFTMRNIMSRENHD